MEYPQITQISAKRLSITVEPEHFIPRMCAVSLLVELVQSSRQSLCEPPSRSLRHDRFCGYPTRV